MSSDFRARRTTRATAAYRKKARNHFRNLAQAGGAELPAAETFADCFAALIEGALVLRQTHGRNDAARAVRPAVEQLVGAYLPIEKRAATVKERDRSTKNG